MKVIIIEDEKPAARRLNRLLLDQGIEVQTMLHSVAEAVAWFSNHDHPDLILLDIQLSDGLSFDIFEKIKINSAIIFTTAFDDYTLKAFKLNSIDYLLKPIDEDELGQAIQKFQQNNFKHREVHFDIQQIKKLLTHPLDKNYKSRFTVKVGQHLKMFHVSEIECFYSDNKATYLHTNSNRNYLIETTIEQLEDQLDPMKFFRVNRKFTINIESIADIISYSNSRLQIKLKCFSLFEIIVSRERVKDFKLWLE